MKKYMVVLLAAITLLSCLSGCGANKNAQGEGSGTAANNKPEYEYMVTTEDTIASSRFGFEFKATDGYAVLTDDMVETYGGCTEEDILTGDSYKKDSAEYKLHKIAMVTDFVNNQFITFSVQPVTEGSTLADFHNSMVSATLGSDMTVSDMKDVKINGLAGGTFQIEQQYDDGSGTVSDHWNVIYIVQSGNYMLMVNCSASGTYPTGIVDKLTEVLNITK